MMWLVILLLEILSFLGVRSKVDLDRARNRLRNCAKVSEQLPFIDKKFRELAGHPNRMEKLAAKKITAGVRRAVNLRVFEYLVQGLVNTRSKFHTGKYSHLLRGK